MSKKESEPQPEEKLTIADLMNAVSDTSNDDESTPTTDIEFAHEVVETLFNPSNINMITSEIFTKLSHIKSLRTSTR